MKSVSKRIISLLAACALIGATMPVAACSSSDDELVLRVANWEEYIDLGDWDEDERIDIENPYADGEDGIFGDNSVVEDFTEWFNSTHDYKVKVEYSTFGTNEDLYNRLNLGDVYDLVCPSDYLIMQLIRENRVEKFSDAFLDADNEDNYYVNNVSSYIKNDVFEKYGWNDYAACYMWGTTGIVYNLDEIEKLGGSLDDLKSWSILSNPIYKRHITIKDNVRDAYFSTLGIIKRDDLLAADGESRKAMLNDTSDETIEQAEQELKRIKENVYSFETDSGKADMITGKVAANLQWSGDAVYIMDEAEADLSNPTLLWYSVPDECTNLWFDGWMMLKDGIHEKEDNADKKKEAAEAFINFLSRPDIAIRNMNYIGYTSAIASETVYNYLDYNYGVTLDPSDKDNFDPELTEVCAYDLTHFFGEERIIYLDASDLEFAAAEESIVQLGLEDFGNDIEYTVYSNLQGVDRGRQAFAQYPPQDVIKRSVIMEDFGDRLPDINRMWINVRCLDVNDFNPAVVWTVVAVVLAGAAAIVLYKFRYKIFFK